MPTDETRWMAAAIELITLVSVLLFCIVRSGS
jgi:hypothetical protein